jgi:L-ribulokinase
MPLRAHQLTLGLDFGTESVRALLVDLHGQERGLATRKYRHGQILESLPGSGVRLPLHYALQHPADWLESAAEATRDALSQTGLPASAVLGLGVDFTSCTMLPARRDGTPLCLLPDFAAVPLAWPKLWKHHGAHAQTERMNEVAARRDERFLPRYGGHIGIEWFFPKMLETLEHAPQVYQAADVWLEAGDWFVWQLVGGEAEDLPRSTCQAGYKGLWSSSDGFPSTEFLGELHPDFGSVVADKMPGRLLSPGTSAGGLLATMAEKLGLVAGTPVSAAIIDAHAGVPGAGADEPGALVMVLGTSSCHMLNSTRESFIPGVAGIVHDGILPGFFGYETGQAAVGDAFDWLRRLTGQADFMQLSLDAADLPPGADGLLCLDWFNGCRTPLMDHALTGVFSGLRLHHTPAHLYRALIEATACGVRWIVELLREHGIEVSRFIATGGLPHHNPLIVEIYASVLGEPITVHPCKHGPALGAAILGALAADLFATPGEAIRALACIGDPAITPPRPEHRTAYDDLYHRYRRLAAQQHT